MFIFWTIWTKCKEKETIYDIYIFVVHVYVKYWFLSSVAAFAQFKFCSFLSLIMKKVFIWKNILYNIKHNNKKKKSGHLWYLTSETVALTFFDKNFLLKLEEK